MSVEEYTQEPTMLVLFGATGDLVKKKVAPALFELYCEGKLPKTFRVIGMARAAHTNESFQKHIRALIDPAVDGPYCIERANEFVSLFSYHRGDFDVPEDFETLKNQVDALDAALGVCTNKLFFFSVLPKYYEPIFTNAAKAELTNSCGNAWARLLIEKPLGHNSETARTLNGLLATLFKEEQLYRIEHYLSKDMVQAILPFRFGNPLFAWDNTAIGKVHIKLLEKVDAAGRGAFYESVGALRDVGQNHLLQMLSLIAMYEPRDWSAEAVQNARAQILNTLIPLTETQIKTHTFRAQYDGYRDTEHVAPDSTVETYYRAIAYSSDPRWEGVPFVMESGKALGDAVKEIRITYRQGVYPSCEQNAHAPELIIHIEPTEEIVIHLSAHKAGALVCGSTQVVRIPLEQSDGSVKEKRQYIDEYKKIFTSGLIGDRTTFVSADEVAAMWRWVDPIIDAWQKNVVPLHTYQAGTKDIISEADKSNTY